MIAAPSSRYFFSKLFNLFHSLSNSSRSFGAMVENSPSMDFGAKEEIYAYGFWCKGGDLRIWILVHNSSSYIVA